jgi:hypothetical protein
MKKTKIFKKLLTIIIFISLLVQISACGYILYPERRGQTGGRIDVGVAVLDGIGLLFFLVPGIIAFAVDFSSGCIYLPGGYAAGPDADEVKVVHVNPAELNEATISRIIFSETGISTAIDLDKALVCRLNGTEDIPEKFAGLQKSGLSNSRYTENYR